MKIYYAVSQYDNHAHEHRWIFDRESETGKKITEALQKGGGFYLYHGAECGIEEITSDSEALNFLTRPSLGVDREDPTMAELTEYYLTVDTDLDSCTQEFLTRLNLWAKGLIQRDPRYKKLEVFGADLRWFSEHGQERYSKVMEHKDVFFNMAKAFAWRVTERINDVLTDYGVSVPENVPSEKVFNFDKDLMGCVLRTVEEFGLETKESEEEREE